MSHNDHMLNSRCNGLPCRKAAVRKRQGSDHPTTGLKAQSPVTSEPACWATKAATHRPIRPMVTTGRVSLARVPPKTVRGDRTLLAAAATQSTH